MKGHARGLFGDLLTDEQYAIAEAEHSEAAMGRTDASLEIESDRNAPRIIVLAPDTTRLLTSPIAVQVESLPLEAH